VTARWRARSTPTLADEAEVGVRAARASLLAVSGAIATSLLLAALVTAIFLGATRPSPIRLDVVHDQLVVRLAGKDAAFALSRGMTIPLAVVEGVAVARAEAVPRTGMRIPGTSIPGLLRAGSFGSGDQRDFWLVRRAPEVLVVQLRPGAPYRRLVLEVPDPREQARRLRPLLGGCTHTFDA
jgi:hypothetical protein